MGVLDELQEAAAAAVASTGPSVVGLGFGWRSASGVVVADGQVLTCAHAVRGGEVTAVFGGERRATGRPTAVDAVHDLALVEVDTGDAPVVEWRGDPARIGMPVFALARLGDGSLRATSGAVSALGRSFRGPRGRRVAGSIEHTAAVARGSAGGPLVDAAGTVLGLNTVRIDGGLVLALGADADLHGRVEALLRGQAPVHRSLGVGVVPSRVARRMRRAVGLAERDGLLVRKVRADGPAAAAGIQPGDLIVAAGGAPVTSIDDLYAALDRGEDGAVLRIGLVRGESEHEVDVAAVEG
jgi:serine protease Do